MTQECIPVQLPSMGEGVNEATIVKWLKKLGDKIAKDEPLLEISTDKVDTEVTSPSPGYLLAIHCQEGDVVEVDQVIAHLGENADAKPPTVTEKPPPQSASASDQALRVKSQQQLSSLPSTAVATSVPFSPGSYAGSVRSSPLVKKMARDYGINLNQVPGTGLHGRITKKDMVNFINLGGARHLPPQPAEHHHPQTTYPLHTTWKDGKEYLEGVKVERKKMSKMRRLTAEHMRQSVNTSPHVTTTFEVDLERVSRIKSEISESFYKQYKTKLTYTSFFIAAAIHGLKRHPAMNASVDHDDVLYKDAVNIGCAVAIDNGLIVPVIKNANHLSLGELAQRLGELVEKARSKKLKPEDVSGGTFSLTNPGMYGSVHSQPIINQPQVGIMSIGAIVRRPVAIGEQIKIHPLCQIGVTFDHRLIDGEGGAKFLADVKHFLESFEWS